MGLPLHAKAAACKEGEVRSYAGGSWSAWDGLCFLRQFEFTYGLDFYRDFFQVLNGYQNNAGINDWASVHDAFEDIAAEDVTATFQAWGVPHPG